MHPAWEHIRAIVEDPERAWDRRIEVARQSGVPSKALAAYEERRGEDRRTSTGSSSPTASCFAGVEIETDLGTWQRLRDARPRAFPCGPAPARARA